jgi:hypothetical protein
MRPTELLQEIRKMRFEEAYLGSQPGAEAGRGGAAAWSECAAGEAVAAELSARGAAGVGVAAPGAAQQPTGCQRPPGTGAGAGALPGLRADARLREAHRGPWAEGVGGDLAGLND